MPQPLQIAPASGRLGILTPGMGAVASTAYAGVLAARQGLAVPIGSLTQMAHIRLGRREDGRNPLIRDFAPLAQLDDLVFGGWDPISPNALEAARTAGVLEERDLAPLSGELEGINAMPAVFDQRWVKRLDGVRVKTGESKWDLAQQLIADIQAFAETNGCDRLVAVWCGSTEVYREPTEVHASLAAFEQGLKDSDPDIAPSQIYAYAACLCYSLSHFGKLGLQAGLLRNSGQRRGATARDRKKRLKGLQQLQMLRLASGSKLKLRAS